MQPTSAMRVGSFEVLREIGRGGMGVVYLARDTRLDRQVAVKALPEDFAADPERLARFEREARTLASLNHPNVAAIHGVEEHEGRRYLILEFVEGQTLAERLEAGPLPIDETLELCVQVAAGLEAAHEAGVIHRDLKPGNIKITPEGRVKVLDFGLAKSAARPGSSSSMLRDSPTMSIPATPHSPTIPGAILGTAPYMSPEQARGRSVDKRSDIWSFGVILYECLTGVSPFTGETVSDSIGAILHKDPELSRLPPATPALVRHLLRRCLERDKTNRLHDVADARIELEQARRDPVAGLGAGAQGKASIGRRHVILFSVVVVALAAAGIAIGVLLRRSGTGTIPVFAQIPPPKDVRLVFAGDLAGPVTVSPDGSMLAFVAKPKSEEQRIWLRRLDRTEAEALGGTEGATFPFWSPDSRSIGFTAQGRLRRIDLGSGAVTTICEARAGRGGTWTPSNWIVFSPGFQSPIFKVPAEGGTPQQITEIDTERHTSHRWPFALPDGEHFIFSAVSHNPTQQEESSICLGTVSGGPPIRISRSNFSAQYFDGRLLFVHDGTILAAPFDLRTGKISGDAVPLVKGVAADITTWNAAFSVSPANILAYHAASSRNQAMNQPGPGTLSTGFATFVVNINRDGRPGAFWLEGVPNQGLSLSPDSKMLATSAAPQGAAGPDIWIYPLPTMEEREAKLAAALQPTRLTFRQNSDVSPVWAPNGRELAYGNVFGGRGEQRGIWTKQIGGGTERLLLKADSDDIQIWPTDWSGDAKHILYTRGNWTPAGINDIWALPLDGSPPFVVVATPADDSDGQLSPNGRWLAYGSEESGAQEDVYVVPFAPGWKGEGAPAAATTPTGKWRISIAGGRRPRWSADGKELFFINPSGSIIAIQVTSEGDLLRFDTGTPLFQIGGDPSSTDFGVTSNGQNFFIQGTEALSEAPMSIVLNWQRLLDNPRR